MKLENIFIVLGPPGSGKGTQSELLAKYLKAPRIVLGDLIREYIKTDSAAKSLYDKGIPQPDSVAITLLKSKLESLQDSSNAVLDTYPLSIGQAEALEQIAAELQIKNLKVFFLNVNEDEAVNRVMERKSRSSVARTDDTVEVAHHRYKEYEKRNAPIKEYYKKLGSLVEINGEQPIDMVHSEIIKNLR